MTLLLHLIQLSFYLSIDTKVSHQESQFQAEIFIQRKKQFLTFHTKKLLAMSLIQCHFDYASPVWFYGLTEDLKSKLQVTQNKLIRFVLNLEPRSHIGYEDFIKLNWFPVSDRVDQVTLCHVFKMHNNLAPKYMSEHFSPTRKHIHI